jgi:hypothetical protein
MRRISWACAAMGVAVVVAGCKSGTSAKQTPLWSIGQTNLPATTTPLPARRATVIPGRIDAVNARIKYVVISYPLGPLPAVGTSLGVYRDGARIAEVRVTLPQKNNLTAADIVSGDCQIGDEVR